MLRSLQIERFKSIYHADLSFGKANLFLGPNGSGKSNILEALGLLAAALSKGLDPANLDDRGIRLSLPAMFKSAFKNTNLPQQFRLRANFDHGHYLCSIRAGTKRTALEFHSEALFDGDTKVFGRGPNGIRLNNALVPEPITSPSSIESSRGLWGIISPFSKISKELRKEIDDFSGFNIYAPQTAVMRGVAIDSRVKEPLGLTGSGLATAFEQVLDQTSLDPKERDKILSIIWEPGWADQIRIAGFDSQIVPSHIKSDGTLLYIRDKFMNIDRNYLSAFDASEGTLYLVFVATLLAHQLTPRAFALDNVDGTLNPRLVRRLSDVIVKVCCQTNSAKGAPPQRQAFVTSHHPSSLDSFDLFDDEQAVFVAHRNTESAPAKGSTTFDRLRPPAGLTKDQWAERSGGRNLSNLLLDGLIPGAI